GEELHSAFSVPVAGRHRHPPRRLALASGHQKSETVISGTYAHAQIAHHQLITYGVVAHPVVRKPTKTLQLRRVRKADPEFRIEVRLDVLSRSFVEKARNGLNIAIVVGADDDTPQNDIEWLRRRKDGQHGFTLRLQLSLYARLYRVLRRKRHGQV